MYQRQFGNEQFLKSELYASLPRQDVHSQLIGLVNVSSATAAIKCMSDLTLPCFPTISHDNKGRTIIVMLQPLNVVVWVSWI